MDACNVLTMDAHNDPTTHAHNDLTTHAHSDLTMDALMTTLAIHNENNNGWEKKTVKHTHTILHSVDPGNLHCATKYNAVKKTYTD